MALGLNSCLYIPKTSDDASPAAGNRVSDASLLSPTATPVDGRMSDSQRPMTPSPSSSGLRLPKHASKSSKVCMCTLNEYS